VTIGVPQGTNTKESYPDLEGAWLVISLEILSGEEEKNSEVHVSLAMCLTIRQN
jgi:hypothetical protein